jgi:uncharacterized protein (TIRG00374 family)
MALRRLRQALKWLLIALALWLVARLLADLGWRDLAARVGDARWSLLAVAVAALVLRYVAWAWRWRLAAIRVAPAPSLPRMLLMLMAAATVNHVTPGARVLGGVLRGRYLARSVGGGSGGGVGRAFGSVLYDQIVHQAAMTAISVAALIAAALAVGRLEAAAVLAAGALLAVGAIVVWLRRRTANGGAGVGVQREGRIARFLAERAARAAGRTRRLIDYGREAVDTVARLLGDRRLALEAAALGLAISLLNGFAQWVVFAALGAAPNLFVVLAVVAVGTAAGIALGTPGGAGTTEAAMIAAFTAFGVDRLDATAATLLYRGLHYASLLAIGGAALVGYEGFPGRRAPTAEATPPTSPPQVLPRSSSSAVSAEP